MNVRTHVVRWLLVLAVFPCLPLVAFAQERAQPQEHPGPISDLWVLWLKDGQRTAFETAIRSELAWRKQAGDPLAWTILEAYVGEDIGHFVLHSDGHEWAQFDEATAWRNSSGAARRFLENIVPLLARIDHHVVRDDREHSNWVQGDYAYFGIAEMDLVPGSREEVIAGLRRIRDAAARSKWAHPWAVNWVIGSDHELVLVYPFTGWADMADPEPSLAQMLAESMGTEQNARGWLRRFDRLFESSRYTIYRARPELSTPSP